MSQLPATSTLPSGEKASAVTALPNPSLASHFMAGPALGADCCFGALALSRSQEVITRARRYHRQGLAVRRKRQRGDDADTPANDRFLLSGRIIQEGDCIHTDSNCKRFSVRREYQPRHKPFLNEGISKAPLSTSQVTPSGSRNQYLVVTLSEKTAPTM